MGVSKQTFSTVRDILQQLDSRISEARERRTGSPDHVPQNGQHERQFGAVDRAGPRLPENTNKPS